MVGLNTKFYLKTNVFADCNFIIIFIQFFIFNALEVHVKTLSAVCHYFVTIPT